MTGFRPHRPHFRVAHDLNYNFYIYVSIAILLRKKVIVGFVTTPNTKGEGARPVRFSKKIFPPNWLIFGTRGFSGTRNRLAQVPSFKKIFLTPYRGYPMLKKSIFSTFLFWLQIGWFLVLGGFRVREIDWRRSRVPKTISHARKPPEYQKSTSLEQK